MKNTLSSRRFQILQCWPQILFLLSFAASVVTTFYVTKNILDSDASSELVLSHYLAHSPDFILSKDWFYSTELRVLNTQLVYSILFHFFSDWSFVRFCSAMILQVILLASCGYLLHQAGFGKKVFFLSGALLLLPVSVTYGRIVLYHCYYVPHLALSFFLLGLTLGFTKPVRWKSCRPYIRLAVLLLFSFVGGLGGVRQLMVTHAPLLLCIVAFYFLEDARLKAKNESSFLRSGNLAFFLVAVASAVFSFLGLKVNTGVLANHFSFQQQSDMLLGFLPMSELANVAYGFFHQFGYRKNLTMLSLMGILSVGGIFAGGYCIFLSIRCFLSHAPGKDLRRSILQLFALSVTAVTLLLFILTGAHGDYHYVLYLVFSLPWSVLLLASVVTDLPRETHPLQADKLLPILAVLILLANGLVNVLYFHGNEIFDQVYEGLHFHNKDIKDSMTDVSSFIVENGYDVGYATFWNGNILTEITDGRIRMVGVCLLPKTEYIIFDNWLSFFSYREQYAEKPFMIIEVSEFEDFALTKAYQNCTLVYQDEYYYVFDIIDQALNKDLLNTDLSKVL